MYALQLWIFYYLYLIPFSRFKKFAMQEVLEKRPVNMVSGFGEDVIRYFNEVR